MQSGEKGLMKIKEIISMNLSGIAAMTGMSYETAFYAVRQGPYFNLKEKNERYQNWNQADLVLSIDCRNCGNHLHVPAFRSI